jgi:hypothetical protein
MPTGETIEGVRIIFHREASGWWAESPDVEGWSVAGDTYAEIRRLVVDGVGFRPPSGGTMARTRPLGDEALSATQVEEEARFRKVEGAMLHVEDAARRLAETAEELRRDNDAPAYLVAALETAAGAVRADHQRLMKSVYWPAPIQTRPEYESRAKGTE